MATSSSIDIHSAIAEALTSLGDLTLKPEQVKAIKLLSQGHDVFVWFPTGYGKSICYQVLPFVFDRLLGRSESPSIDQSVVLVVSPLVSLMVRGPGEELASERSQCCHHQFQQRDRQ